MIGDSWRIVKLGLKSLIPITTSLEDGLDRTVEWYRDNRAWWEPLKARS